MALFQRKVQASANLPYTIGGQETLLVVGLGNPGAKYRGTRHNIGFEVLDSFVKHHDFPEWQTKKDLKCQISQLTTAGKRLLLVKPETFMNLSGEAVQAVQSYFKLTNNQTLAVYDDLAIPFGQLRTRVGGSDAGHNGVKSLIQHLGEDFGRLRIGVGSDLAAKKDGADFVLAKFSRAEQSKLAAIIREAEALISEYVASGQVLPETRTAL